MTEMTKILLFGLIWLTICVGNILCFKENLVTKIITLLSLITVMICCFVAGRDFGEKAVFQSLARDIDSKKFEAKVYKSYVAQIQIVFKGVDIIRITPVPGTSELEK